MINYGARDSRMKSDRTRPMTFKSKRKSYKATERSLAASDLLALAFSADELLHAPIRFFVGHLDRRILGEKRRGGMQHPTDAPIQRKLATTDGVDCDAG